MKITTTIPGYFGKKQAEKIKRTMQGKTYMNFNVDYSNECGNCSIIVSTDYFEGNEYDTLQHFQDALEQDFMYYTLSELTAAEENTPIRVNGFKGVTLIADTDKSENDPFYRQINLYLQRPEDLDLLLIGTMESGRNSNDVTYYSYDCLSDDEYQTKIRIRD